jgi:hypothetical protein
MRAFIPLSLLLTTKAAVLPQKGLDGLPAGCDDTYLSIPLVEFNDGPTTSGEAGIGAEFETIGIQFYDNKCSLENTFLAKRKTIKGHTGKNYVLSADTSTEKGKLSAEYVLDGRNIRVGDGSAAAAGKAIRDDMVRNSMRGLRIQCD